MTVRDLVASLRDTILRLLPHRTATGLIRIGDPTPESPVLLTGNYTLTVRRLRRALHGTDAWLLVADSRGINVWCAAGGGHLTHHDVISVLRTSGIDDLVAHRRLMLPQLAATGVERRPIERATGWATHWGPARLEDLPAVLARGGAVRGHDRRMRFPLWERLEMASLWFLPMALILGLLAWPVGGRAAAIAAASLVVVLVAGRFAALPRHAGGPPPGWRSYLGLSLIGGALGIGGLAIQGALDLRGGMTVAAASIISTAVLSIDLPGTTPLYPGAVNTRSGTPRISLDLDRCTGAADCIEVCPCDVLELESGPRRAVIARPEACIACAACIVQCPEDALFFLMPDGRAVDAETVRRTRLNLLGDRSVEVARAR